MEIRFLSGTEQIVSKKVFLDGLEVEDLRFTENNPIKATIARFQEFSSNDYNYTENVNFGNELSIKKNYGGTAGSSKISKKPC
jgi:hypothetical protein